MVSDTLGTLLEAASDDSGLVIDLANDEDGGDNARCQALQYNRLVVINGYLRTVVGEGYRIRRRRGVIGLGRWWRWSIDPSGGLVDVDDVHDEGVFKKMMPYVRNKM